MSGMGRSILFGRHEFGIVFDHGCCNATFLARNLALFVSCNILVDEEKPQFQVRRVFLELQCV